MLAEDKAVGLYAAKVRKSGEELEKKKLFCMLFGRIRRILITFAAVNVECMQKIIPIILMGSLLLLAGACKEEEKSKNIITHITPKAKPKAGIEKTNDFSYQKQVVFAEDTLDINIHRFADQSLPLVEDESGRKYLDNKVELLIKRKDGRVFLKKTFSKADFSDFTDNVYGRCGGLIGFMFDKVERGKLCFGASVGSPDVSSDEFVPIGVTIDGQGKLRFHSAMTLDTESSKAAKEVDEIEAAAAEGV